MNVQFVYLPLNSSVLHRRRRQEDSPGLSNSEVEQLSRVSSCLNNLVRWVPTFSSYPGNT
jgi:hypothetical protein